jgi:signal transduction histidine kinase
VLTDRPVQRLTIKAALLLGFGLTVGLWLLAGYQFTRRMAEVERESAAINRRYMSAQDLLSTVRAQVLIGSVLVRDALLDPNPASAAAYREQLLTTYVAVDGALARYVPVLDTPAERARVERLSEELRMLRTSMLEVLQTPRRGSAEAQRLLQRHIMPKREAVVRVSEEVQALNRETFVQQQAGVREVYRVTQRRVWRQLGLALVASLGIALLASLYAGRLENQLRRQRAKDAQNAEDLQRLSAKLITAQEEERRSIARELHDEVGQVLTAIKMELAVAQTTIEASGIPARVLDDARVMTEGALHTVRDLSHLLHPAMLDDLGLRAALDWYLRGVNKRNELRAKLQHDGMEERLALEIEVAAFRIVQEAITNVIKHARATTCTVDVVWRAELLKITIEDDGIGFEVAQQTERGRRRGLGLVGMRERVAQLRGLLRIESIRGSGTRILVELPARARAMSDSNDAGAGSGKRPAAVGTSAAGRQTALDGSPRGTAIVTASTNE